MLIDSECQLIQTAHDRDNWFLPHMSWMVRCWDHQLKCLHSTCLAVDAVGLSWAQLARANWAPSVVSVPGLVWAPSQHGGWVLKESIHERREEYMTFLSSNPFKIWYSKRWIQLMILMICSYLRTTKKSHSSSSVLGDYIFIRGYVGSDSNSDNKTHRNPHLTSKIIFAETFVHVNCLQWEWFSVSALSSIFKMFWSLWVWHIIIQISICWILFVILYLGCQFITWESANPNSLTKCSWNLDILI